MITFKQYLREVLDTKRRSMVHLQNMKPAEFVQWAKEVHADLGGELKDLEVSLKVDGLGARFGKSEDGRYFFEGSRTGAIFDAGAFSKHAASRGSSEESLSRAAHYDEMFNILRDSKLAKSLPNDTKVICEIFYMPLGTHVNGFSRFVSIDYDTSKLGSVMTVVPISVIVASTGEEHPDEASLIAGLLKLSSSSIKVVDVKLKSQRIDVSANIADIVKFGDAELQILKSLKHADRESKRALTELIQNAKDQLAAYLLAHKGVIGKEILGPNIEGLVFKINNQLVKVTTQEFKDSKKAK